MGAARGLDGGGPGGARNQDFMSIGSTLIYRPSSIVDRLRWAEVFEAEGRIEVELGSGDGGFLAEYAGRHPERSFLGVERLLGRLRKLDRKGRRMGLMNLRLLRIEAAYLVEYLLPAGGVEALHIYFPDPWPKRRHWRRRLIQPSFISAAAHALGAGGRLYFRTDDRGYWAWAQEVCGQCALLRAVETPAELRAVETDFERDFRARGLEIHTLAYERRMAAPCIRDQTSMMGPSGSW